MQQHVFAAGAKTLALAALLCALPAQAQQVAARRTITQDDYDRWRSIQGAALSPDGRWVAYTLTPQVGEGELVVRSSASGVEHRVPRGYTGRPQLQAGAQSRSGFVAPAARFTADGRHVVFTILPSQAEVEGARRARRKPADQPKSSLGILRVEDGSVTRVPGVKSFALAEESGRWVAYLMEGSAPADSAQEEAPAGVAAATPGGQPRPISTDSTAERRERKKDPGTRLVLRDLGSGAERSFEEVTAYVLDEAGEWLAFTVSSRSPARDGAFVHSLRDGATHTLLAGEGNYKRIALDEAGRQVAFLSDQGSYRAEHPRYALYHAALASPAARAVVTPATLRDGWSVSEKGEVAFTRNGEALTFGIAPVPADSIPADSLADKAVFDLWHWRDLRLQPQQRVEASQDRDRTFAAVYQIRARKFVTLADETLPEVELSEDGRVALGITESPYAIEAMWGEGGYDAYVIDATTGARTKVAERLEFEPFEAEGGAVLSPGGGFVTWFKDGKWWAYQLSSKRAVELTGKLGVQFDREDWSTPSTPAPWGLAGWTPGDRSVLLYDRHDVWEVDPTGRRPARVVTDSAGRRANRVYRVVDLDEEEPYLDPAKPLLLSLFDEGTKASGFAEDRIAGEEAPRTLVMADVRFGEPLRAEDADLFLVTRSTFREFPDLWAGERFDALRKLSDANPQQAEYAWGTVERVQWRSDDGVPLDGLLYKPEGFDPSRKYPMVVYFYEEHSDEVHAYHAPAGRNIVNPTVYANQGYLVFMPDIAYTTGYPGPSALKSVVPGVQSLIARGFVDPDGVGIAGQSWGGYQSAYIITQTNLFKAAVPNATVANMTSAYGGIRWGTGLARAFQYEHTQSRIGGSIWEYPMRYLENSPLFHADKVQTPVLMMHNDNDGAVPWYQGIELFVALRRLGKEVYLINYNGDEHNPTKRANQKDIDLRMRQFFDHHLRGAPAPEWMQRGIPFLEKGRDQLRRSTTSTEANPSMEARPGGR